MSTDVSGAITAVATAVLAVFAIVTAIYAIRAFRKQSKEVSEQAKMLKVQSDQLDEQRKINERQTEVLALQEADLRESLAERRREVARRPSAQASRVSLIAKVVWVTPKDFDSGFRLEVTVVNANDPQQPVYDARLYWYCDGELYGRDSPEDLGTVLATATAFRDFMPGSKPHTCGAILTFKDAVRASWIRDADGNLIEGSQFLVTDLVRALSGSSGGGASSPHIAPDAG